MFFSPVGRYCDSDKWFLTFIHDWLCEEDTGDDSHYGGDRSAKQDWGWGVAASKSTLIIYIEVNSLSSEFQPGSSSNGWDSRHDYNAPLILAPAGCWGTVQTLLGANKYHAYLYTPFHTHTYIHTHNRSCNSSICCYKFAIFC